MKLSDTDPMPFGKHRGEPMQDVPVSYLHWLYTKGNIKNANNGVDSMAIKAYIEDNLNALKMENKDLIWK